MARKAADGYFVDAIFFWDRQGPTRHCQLSYEAEMLRHHLPMWYRQQTKL